MKNKLTQFHIRPARPDEAGLFYAQHGAQEKPLVGRVTYANGDAQEFTSADKFLRCVQEELPYRLTTGFRYEVLTDDPAAEADYAEAVYAPILLLLSACGQAPVTAETEAIPQVTQEQKETPMIPTKLQSADESAEAKDNTKAAKPAERVDVPKDADKAAEKQTASAEVEQSAESEPPAAAKPEAKPASEPTPTPTPASKPEPAPTPEPTPTPAPTPEPDPAPTAASGDIYSIAEAVLSAIGVTAADAHKSENDKNYYTSDLLTCHPYASGGKQRYVVVCERLQD